MAKFTISKEPLQPHFLGVNVDTIGAAAGQLKYCSMKLYLYLMCNSDGFTWNMNPAAFAKWMGVDYNNASEARKVRKIISDGIADLKACGFLKEVENDTYDISEQIVPEWLESNLGTKSSKEVVVQEQIVPKIQGNTLGTKSSESSAQKEQIVPDCYGF